MPAPFDIRRNVLVVDDNALNREVFSDVLSDEYGVIQASDGLEAIDILEKRADDVSLVLLDINMPRLDGIGVLEAMNERGWMNSIPVIVVSADSDMETMSRAFDLRATDYIDREFNKWVVKKRVENAIALYDRQKRIIDKFLNELMERVSSNDLMVSILSHIVEFRNRESGLHVMNIRRITRLILNVLAEKTQDPALDPGYISLVSMASALHDIGKIAIPEEILNKPGRLTEEEYEAMKRHTLIGAEMLDNIPKFRDEPLAKAAYEICRWHHERYDGGGYPDGLSGDEIPISAQVVALADVYDALTAHRVYKDAVSHDEAVDMILAGECGSFSPVLMECLQDARDDLQAVINEADQEELAWEMEVQAALQNIWDEDAAVREAMLGGERGD